MKSTNPFFSILTVVLNRKNSIERSIQSVITQKFTDYEYVIIDGGSSDGTIDIVKKYEHYISYWISETDKGIYNAMNKGINMLSGKYVILLNSDDWLEEDILNKIYSDVINSNLQSDSIICGGINYYSNSSDNNCRLLTTNQNRFNRLIDMYENPVRHPGTIVPLSIYKELGTFDERYSICADEDFILRSYFNQKKFVFFNYAISNMKEGGISTDKRNLSRLKKEHLDILKRYKKNRIKYLYLKLRFSAKILCKQLIPDSILFSLMR